MANVKIDPSWQELLNEEFEKPYFDQLTAFVREAYQTHVVFPPAANIFRAFDSCPADRLKVVIIGQDPYHNVGQANGLCFSVAAGTQFPPSLQNILKGAPYPETGELDRWAEQGVLMLNSVLTVQAHTPTSHAGKGWEEFTDAVVRTIAQRKNHVVYMLWGSYAQRKAAAVDPAENCILLQTFQPRERIPRLDGTDADRLVNRPIPRCFY